MTCGVPCSFIRFLNTKTKKKSKFDVSCTYRTVGQGCRRMKIYLHAVLYSMSNSCLDEFIQIIYEFTNFYLLLAAVCHVN